MILDRSIAPKVEAITDFAFPAPQFGLLDNQMPFHWVKSGVPEVCALQISFLQKPSLSFASSFMMTKTLLEGTKKHTGEQISEILEHWGISVGVDAGLDFIHIELYCLTKYLPKALPILLELIQEANFSEDALNKQKNIQLQQLQINLEKNSYLASQLFRENLFGENTFYGKRIRVEDLQALSTADLEKAYQENILGQAFSVMLAGNFGTDSLDLIRETLGKLPVSRPFESASPQIDFPKTIAKKLNYPKTDALQSSIRIGKRIFGQNSPELNPYTVLNEILGGYFGSRLMKNIREEKGLTYGIYSSYVAFRGAAYMVIATDVKSENLSQALDEIYKEMRLLCEKQVSANELETVKSYMIGTFINSFGTPLAIAEKYQAIFLRALPADYYQNFIGQIRGVSAEQIQNLAQKYYHDFLELVVGNPA